MSDFTDRFKELLVENAGVLTRQFFEKALYVFENVEEVEFIRWFKPFVDYMRLIDPDEVMVFFEEYYPLFEEKQRLQNSNYYTNDEHNA